VRESNRTPCSGTEKLAVLKYMVWYSVRMKVIILCGGQGTRLREETEFKPKPMVTVGGRPILWHIMKMYAHFGHKDFVLCLGYKGQMIKEYFLNYHAMSQDVTVQLGKHQSVQTHGSHDEEDFTVTLVDTGADAMTGSRIKQVEKYADDELFCVTYGDGLSDVDISKVVEFHKKHGKIGTVTSVRTQSRFGILNIDGSDAVSNFAEKPQTDGWISSGFFVFDKRFFDYLSADESCVMEQDPLQNLAKDGQLMAYKHEGFFYAMDTFRESLKLNELWDNGEAPWAHWRKASPELKNTTEQILLDLKTNTLSPR
jgi:glucose-1-phosphate cytidylyltransferase